MQLAQVEIRCTLGVSEPDNEFSSTRFAVWTGSALTQDPLELSERSRRKRFPHLLEAHDRGHAMWTDPYTDGALHGLPSPSDHSCQEPPQQPVLKVFTICTTEAHS